MAPIADPVSGGNKADFIYPLALETGRPVNLNIHRLSLECLPVLDVSQPSRMEWLTTHVSITFSARERKLRESSNEIDDIRVNFKESLFSMFIQFSGLQGRKTRIFGLYHPGAGGCISSSSSLASGLT
jgi:hypothetical protein